MRVAILYPTVLALIEKMACLFPDGLEVIGPPPDDSHPMVIEGRLKEWSALGLNVSYHNLPYSEIDFSHYDLLIQSVETFNYSKDWVNHCDRVECPILVKVCWTKTPRHLPSHYVDAVKSFPVAVEMPAHLGGWTGTAFTDCTLLPEPVGDWWFERPWTGSSGDALFVLAGKDLWRPADTSCCGVDLYEKLCQLFPGRIHHHDGAVSYKTTPEMTHLYSTARVFLNLDRPYGDGERPLAASFTEAVAAGCPVVARNIPGLSYSNFIDSNGICTDDFDAIVGFIRLCLEDWDSAKRCSLRSREIGYDSFSTTSLRPKYDSLLVRSRIAFHSLRGIHIL